MKIFGERIRGLVEQQGIDRDDLARFLGVKKEDIILWENDLSEPIKAIETLVKLSRFFNVAASYFLGIEKS